LKKESEREREWETEEDGGGEERGWEGGGEESGRQNMSTFPALHTGWQRPMGCLIFVGNFPQKIPIIIGSLAENDL